MHELGLIASVMEVVEDSARAAGATAVTRISLVVGVMTEAVPESLQFAFEALSEGTIAEGAELQVEVVGCRSKCSNCGAEYEHSRFHLACPECGSYSTQLLAGRDLYIDSIEVDLPDEQDSPAGEEAGEEGECG